MVLVKYVIGFILIAMTLLSCADGKSLQRYLVDKQDDDKFLKVDIATSLLESDDADFTEEQREILNSVKKINVVAYPTKGENIANYEAERLELKQIIDQEKYTLLGSFTSNGTYATMKYLGEEDAIDEVIIFASDPERGFAIFRLLGDDMKPGQMLKLMNSLDSGDMDLSALGGLDDIFNDAYDEEENTENAD